MPSSELTPEQLIALVKQLSQEKKQVVFSALYDDLVADYSNLKPDLETQEWLEANLIDELPPYEWENDSPPEGKPVRYDPNLGLVVDED